MLLQFDECLFLKQDSSVKAKVEPIDFFSFIHYQAEYSFLSKITTIHFTGCRGRLTVDNDWIGIDFIVFPFKSQTLVKLRSGAYLVTV